MNSYTYQPTAGGPWDTRELYVFNTCAFTIYQLKLAIALKAYVIPKDDTYKHPAPQVLFALRLSCLSISSVRESLVIEMKDQFSAPHRTLILQLCAYGSSLFR